ncbi:hypothetical protein ACFLQI_02035 [Candidatus Undinarchaeota archaeon]
MPNYNVEIYVHEEGEQEVHKIVWVANYSDASTAIETAGRRAIGIANYMKQTKASIHNLGGMTYGKGDEHRGKEVIDATKNIEKIRGLDEYL